MNASGRGSNDDAATTTGAHGWDGILEPEPDTAHVDGYDLIEDVNGVVGNGLYHAFDSGVGEQNVKPLVALERGLDVTLHLGWLGNVRHCVASDCTVKRVHDALQRRFVAVHQQDPGAFVSKELCRSRANASRPTRNYGDFAGKSCHHGSPQQHI